MSEAFPVGKHVGYALAFGRIGRTSAAALTLVPLVALRPPVVTGGEVPINMEAVLRSAESRDANLRELYIEYEERVEGSPAALKSDMLAKIIAWSKRIQAFKGEKQFMDYTRMRLGKPDRVVGSYNGYICKLWYQNNRQGVVQKSRSNLTGTSPYFANVFFPVTINDRLTVKEGVTTFSLVDSLKEPGWRILPSRETIDDVSCLVIERANTDKMWMDPQRDFVVLQREFLVSDPNSEKRFKVTNRMRDCVKVAAGAWLPQNMENTRISMQDPESFLTQVFVVSKVSPQVDDSLFESLQFPPGSDVIDNIANVIYTLPASHEDPFESSLLFASKRTFGGRWSGWLVPLNVGGLALLVIYACLFRRRASTSKTKAAE